MSLVLACSVLYPCNAVAPTSLRAHTDPRAVVDRHLSSPPVDARVARSSAFYCSSALLNDHARDDEGAWISDGLDVESSRCSGRELLCATKRSHTKLSLSAHCAPSLWPAADCVQVVPVPCRSDKRVGSRVSRLTMAATCTCSSRATARRQRSLTRMIVRLRCPSGLVLLTLILAQPRRSSPPPRRRASRSAPRSSRRIIVRRSRRGLCRAWQTPYLPALRSSSCRQLEADAVQTRITPAATTSSPRTSPAPRSTAARSSARA